MNKEELQEHNDWIAYNEYIANSVHNGVYNCNMLEFEEWKKDKPKEEPKNKK